MSLDPQEAARYLHESGVLHAYRVFLEGTFANGLPTLSRRTLYEKAAKTMEEFSEENSGALTSRSLGKRELYDENFKRDKIAQLAKHPIPGPAVGSKIWRDYDSDAEDNELDAIVDLFNRQFGDKGKKTFESPQRVTMTPEQRRVSIQQMENTVADAGIAKLAEDLGVSSPLRRANTVSLGRRSSTELNHMEEQLSKKYWTDRLRRGFEVFREIVIISKQHHKITGANQAIFFSKSDPDDEKEELPDQGGYGDAYGEPQEE